LTGVASFLSIHAVVWHSAVDTGGKIAANRLSTTLLVNKNLRKDVTTSVNDTGGAPCVENVSANVCKNSK
jgi:hypothetical protein